MLGKLIRMLRSEQLKDQREWNKLLVMAAHAVNNSLCTATRVTHNYLFQERDMRAPLDMQRGREEEPTQHGEKAARRLPSSLGDCRDEASKE